MLWLIWTVSILGALMLYMRQKYSRFTKYQVKHFRPWPILGNTARSIFQLEHAVESMIKLNNTFESERFVGTYEFTKPVIVVRDVELIKKITIKDFEYFIDHRFSVDEDAEPLLSRSLLILKGQKWKDMRSTLSPAFTSSKIRLMIPFIEQAVNEMISATRKNIENSAVGYTDVECKDLLSRLTNDVIASCAFGLKVNSNTEKENQFYIMAKKATQFTGVQMLKMFAVLGFPKISKVLNVQLLSEDTRNFFRNLVKGTMDDREKRNIKRHDMIHLLMEAKKGKLTYDEKLSKPSDAGFAAVEESEFGKKNISRTWCDDDLTAQAFLFLLAGFETVSTTMTLLLFELANDIEIQNKLVQEIKETRKINDGKLDFNTIEQMKYMDMVVSETLRKWPPGMISDRMCVKDYNLGKPNNESTEDYIIRRGEGIIVPTWAIHHSPEYYKDPEKFDPERFSELNKHSIDPFTYLPFGVGPRNCIGSRFALCEIKVMLYYFLLSIEVTPSEKTCLPIQLAKNNLNLAIKGGHWLRMSLRK